MASPYLRELKKKEKGKEKIEDLDGTYSRARNQKRASD
jgi:hypothetical protein